MSPGAQQAARLTRALVRADRIAEILGSGEVLEDRPGSYHGEQAAGALAFEGVDFAYEPGRQSARVPRLAAVLVDA